MTAVIRCRPALPGATISPLTFSHSIEHVGRGLYEGVWVDPSERVPHRQCLRLDVLAALTHLRIPAIRWPGGRFADDCHWRDGVGPQNARPRTANLCWGQIEPNRFGTDEFLRFCDSMGAAPYLCVNMGTGSPKDARDWAEYCNFAGDSSLAALRAENGQPLPYGVRYWSIGGGNPLDCGFCSGADYGRAYMRFAAAMRKIAPEAHLVARGASFGDYTNSDQNEWNHELCRVLSRCDLVDSIALRRHFQRGEATAFSEAEYYGLFADAAALERDLELTDAVLRGYFPEKRVGISKDEWGLWHPEASAENGLEQPNALRDALMASSVLHILGRWAGRIVMANLAYAVNALQCLAVTDGAAMFLTPTYHVFDMMRPHMGATTLTLETEGPTFKATPVGFNARQEFPLLDAFASLSGRKALLTVVNRSMRDAVEARIEMREATMVSTAGKLLHANSPRDVNDAAAPSRVAAKRIRPTLGDNGLVHVFPPHSLTALSIAIE